MQDNDCMETEDRLKRSLQQEEAYKEYEEEDEEDFGRMPKGLTDESDEIR